MAAEIKELVCKECGATVSGSDPVDLKDTMDRHVKKAHPVKKAQS